MHIDAQSILLQNALTMREPSEELNKWASDKELYIKKSMNFKDLQTWKQVVMSFIAGLHADNNDYSATTYLAG